MRCIRLIQFAILILSTTSLALSGCNSSGVLAGTSTSPSTPTPSPTSPTPAPSPSPTGPSSSSAAAYVYVVSSQPNTSNPNQIVAYAADANGQLTAVPGSPFSQNVSSLAANGTYLLAAATSAPDINTYTIGSNGAISLASQFNYAQALGYQSSNDTVCSSVGDLLFDHTGMSLYTAVGNVSCSNNNGIASFAVDSSNGSVSYLGDANIGYEASEAISLLGNNSFAYSALNDNCMYGGISSFDRSSSGLLSYTAATVTPQFGPPAPAGATSSGVKEPSYAANLTAADTTNHVAMTEVPCYALGGVAATQVQLATYTADSSGNLTTTDTSASMPGTSVTSPQVLKMSPSGTFLAVAGSGGVQVFNFNGTSPITKLTGLLTTDTVGAIAWDNNNNLYMTTANAYAPNTPITNPNKLYVFTVTDTGATEAPGSPYTIQFSGAIAVQSARGN